MSVYLVGAVDIHDAEGYERYRAGVPKAVAPYSDGVEILSADDNPLVLEGTQPANHLFISEFPSLEVLKEFYYSKAYQQVMQYRSSSAVTKFLMVMRGRDEILERITTPAYFVAAIEIQDFDEYGLYRDQAPKSIAAFPDLKVLSNDDHPLVLEGTQPANHLVLARSASMESAKAFYDSEAYQAAMRHRLKGSKALFYMIMRGIDRKV